MERVSAPFGKSGSGGFDSRALVHRERIPRSGPRAPPGFKNERRETNGTGLLGGSDVRRWGDDEEGSCAGSEIGCQRSVRGRSGQSEFAVTPTSCNKCMGEELQPDEARPSGQPTRCSCRSCAVRVAATSPFSVRARPPTRLYARPLGPTRYTTQLVGQNPSPNAKAWTDLRPSLPDWRDGPCGPCRPSWPSVPAARPRRVHAVSERTSGGPERRGRSSRALRGRGEESRGASSVCGVGVRVAKSVGGRVVGSNQSSCQKSTWVVGIRAATRGCAKAQKEPEGLSVERPVRHRASLSLFVSRASRRLLILILPVFPRSQHSRLATEQHRQPARHPSAAAPRGLGALPQAPSTISSRQPTDERRPRIVSIK